ncbi:MAG: hypothetical protein H8D23_35285 [Candidatus Brocadiales bacterium]|nr:hypothetical protein [Candidatus Brocadiales bacterium]
MQVESTSTQVYETQGTPTVQTDESNTVDSNTTVSDPDTVDLSQESLALASTDFISDVDSETKMKSLNKKVNEFESLVNSLDLNTVDVEAVNSVLATVSSEVDQANEDYQNGNIDEKTLSSTLYATLDRGIDSLNSLTSDANDQTTEVTQSSVESTETAPEDSVATTEEQISIAGMLDTINKIVKVIESASETDNVDKKIEELVEETDSLKLKEELGKAISDLEKIDYSKFADKLRKMQSRMTEDNKMFGGEKKHGGNIGNIGMGMKETDAVQSDGFTANRFINSMSNSINNALESYKEVKEATEEHEEKETKETNEAKQVNAEAELSTVA